MKRYSRSRDRGRLLGIWGATGLAQDKPLKKVVFAVTTKDISVGHSAHSSLPRALGYWKEEGLDVTVTSVEGSAAGMQQLAAGNLQIVSIGPEEIVLGREKGVKIKGFYVQARETIYRIVVPADSPLQKVADLKGKTIGVPSLASGSVPFAKALVASVGIDPEKDVKVLAVGVGAPGGSRSSRNRSTASPSGTRSRPPSRTAVCRCVAWISRWFRRCSGRRWRRVTTW